MIYRGICVGGCADGQWCESRERTAIMYGLSDLPLSPFSLSPAESLTLPTDVYRLEEIRFGRNNQVVYLWLASGLSVLDALSRLCDWYRPKPTTLTQANRRLQEAIQQYDEIAGHRTMPDDDGFCMASTDVDLLDEDRTIDEAMEALRQRRKK